MSEIEVEYALDSPRQIPIDEVLDLEVGLRRAEEAYVAPRPVDRTVRMRLSALPRDASFGASALLHINQHIVASFNRRGYNGVIVTVPDIEEGTGRDLRPPGVTVLRLRIWTGQVVARGDDRRRRALRRAHRRRAHQPRGARVDPRALAGAPGRPARAAAHRPRSRTTRPSSRAIPGAAWTSRWRRARARAPPP